MDDDVQRFSNTSSRVFGIIGIVVAAAVAIQVLTSADPSYAGLALTVFLAALVWSAMLRPQLSLDRSRLVVRNMLSTVTLPLTAIESVAVRQVLVVFAGDRRYTSPAVGRTRRQLHRDERGGPSGGGGGMMGILPNLPSAPETPETAKTSYGLFVEERIRSRVADALAQAGIKARSAQQARCAEDITRRPAIAEIAVLGASLVTFMVLALV
ncbi:hypothetical protein [Nocardioides sp.]|uniref:hypothetical protein n=1 Tax=Nocardioides sp. TaxID=35761 RepID=UPI000C972024|nr:hypothetical protein [Pimelobacter sp.]